jgi:purine-binding chemotaxis protein CheW
MADVELLAEDDEGSSGENKYLLCQIGTEEFGVDIANVQSIEELQKIIAVPDLPMYVKGVINLRGRVVPVIDLRLKFNMEERGYDDRTCIVIARIWGKDIGLIVDTVSEVHDIPESNIDPPPAFKDQTGREKYIAGLGKIGEEVKIILDVSKLFRDDEIKEFAESTAALE